MTDPEENQRRAEQDIAAWQILRAAFFPGWKDEPSPGSYGSTRGRDPFLIPALLFVPGLMYLLHIGDWIPGAHGANPHPRGLGLLALFIFVSRLAIALAIAHVLRRILGFAHGVNPRVAWAIFGCVTIALMGAVGGVAYLKSAKARADETAMAEASEAQRLSAEQSIKAESEHAQAERDSRAALIARWRLARTNAVAAWREKLVATGALGARGVAPPMLDVHDDGKTVTVTNRAKDPACVLVSRIGLNESGAIARCAVGGTHCVLIPRGETRRLPTLSAGNPESCLTGVLEYRVGSVDYPEPSWWSASAFEAFGRRADDETADRWSDERLLSEATRLEKQAP